jgi:hypothetical protein
MGVPQDASHHPHREPAPPVPRIDKYIRKPGERASVGNDAANSDLPFTIEQRKTERVPEGSLDYFPRPVLGPVRGLQRRGDEIHVEVRRIIGQQKLIAAPFHAIDQMSFSAICTALVAAPLRI